MALLFRKYDGPRKIVWAADLDAYGKVAKQIAADVDNPIRFSAQYYDAGSEKREVPRN